MDEMPESSSMLGHIANSFKRNAGQTNYCLITLKQGIEKDLCSLTEGQAHLQTTVAQEMSKQTLLTIELGFLPKEAISFSRIMALHNLHNAEIRNSKANRKMGRDKVERTKKNSCTEEKNPLISTITTPSYSLSDSFLLLSLLKMLERDQNTRLGMSPDVILYSQRIRNITFGPDRWEPALVLGGGGGFLER